MIISYIWYAVSGSQSNKQLLCKSCNCHSLMSFYLKASIDITCIQLTYWSGTSNALALTSPCSHWIVAQMWTTSNNQTSVVTWCKQGATIFPETNKAENIQESKKYFAHLCTQCLSRQSTLPFDAAVLQSKCAGRTFREERKVGEPQCSQRADNICVWPKSTGGIQRLSCDPETWDC